MLLEAWAKVKPEGWILELVGPSEGGHREALEYKVGALGLDGEVKFSGPVDDAAKWRKYTAADLFVLPSHSENFGIVMAEALAAGVPVLTTTSTPWQELEEYDCGWWVKPEKDAIAEALRRATEMESDERTAVGERGRKLVHERYTWQAVGRRMKRVYEWLVHKNMPQPEFIE